MIIFRVRIFCGSDDNSSFQKKALEAALSHYNYFREYKARGVHVIFESWSNLEVKDKQKHIVCFAQIFDWLLEDNDEVHVDTYFLLCHIHQGFKTWRESMDDLKSQYLRLVAHGNGLPSGNQIHCGAFTQDKFEYLQHLPEFVNPTLKIAVSKTYSDREWNQIKAFYDLYCCTPSRAVIKAPYTTNKDWLKYPKKFEKEASSISTVEGTLHKAYEELHGYIPYVMMQPCIDIDAKREQKVVFLGGKASHISTGFSVGRKSFPVDDDAVLAFAQQAHDTLIQRVGTNHWLDQLARFDVMYNEFESRMVINEVESIMACYEMSAKRDEHYDRKVEKFLVEYFICNLEKLVLQKIEAIITSLKK